MQAGPPSRVAILMTCHNRRALTLRCLASLHEQRTFRPEDLFLVDDGSSDGTGDAVRAAMPEANVIVGDGDLFWNGGMRLAWQRAKAAETEFDHYFWLNDDVVLQPGALDALAADAAVAARRDGAVIVVGAMVEPGTDTISYGGQRDGGRKRPLRMTLVVPTGHPEPVDTVSGNAVLVSAMAERVLGNISPAFRHIFGDLDYGLRARAAGVPVVAGSAVAGECAGPDPVPALGRWAALSRRWRAERKLHARDWRVFARRHAGIGPFSILYSVAPYVRLLIGRDAPR